MKLRHKLLLLAAMPLPAILLVALLSVVPRWEQIRDSRVAGNVAEALDAASRMTGALIDERTAVMQRRANDAVSLESLLTLDNANLDSLLDAPEGNALGDAVIASDRAISAYAEAIADTRSLGELRLTMNELLDLARRAQTQRATRDAETGLIAAVLHFKPVIDATGDLYDRASTWLTDEQASDMMRARAAMHRLRDAVASTHGLLGHANATSQATPAVARYLTSLSFQENLQQRLLNEVTQQTATKRAVSAELDRANAQGRARAIDQLLAQSVIQIELGAVLRPLLAPPRRRRPRHHTGNAVGEARRRELGRRLLSGEERAWASARGGEDRPRRAARVCRARSPGRCCRGGLRWSCRRSPRAARALEAPNPRDCVRRDALRRVPHDGRRAR